MEFRATQAEDPKSKHIGTLSGRAISFNEPSKDIGFIETIEERAFSDDVMKHEVFATFNHNKDLILGRSTNGTLRLEKRMDGVYVEIDIPNTSVGRDVAELAERGDLGGFSFEFIVNKGGDSWERRDGSLYRTVHSIKRFYAVNPVADPAYTSNDRISLRNMGESKINEIEEAEKAIQNQKDLDLLKLSGII